MLIVFTLFVGNILNNYKPENHLKALKFPLFTNIRQSNCQQIHVIYLGTYNKPNSQNKASKCEKCNLTLLELEKVICKPPQYVTERERCYNQLFLAKNTRVPERN